MQAAHSITSSACAVSPTAAPLPPPLLQIYCSSAACQLSSGRCPSPCAPYMFSPPYVGGPRTPCESSNQGGQGSDQPCMVRLRAAHSILHIHIWNDLPAPIGNAPQHLFRGLLCSQDSVAGCYARLVWVCDFNSGGRLPCTRTQKTDLRLDCGKATINPSESAVSDHAVWPKFCQGSLRQPADRGKTQRCRPLHVSH